MKILITGGTGFIGSNIAKRLVKERHEVLITGSLSENKPWGTQFCPIHLDGLDLNMLKGVDAVFHQAGINDTLQMDEKMMFRANVYAPYALFEKLYRDGCRTFVYASSTAVYGDARSPYDEDTTAPNPLNPYGQSKLHFEEKMKTFVRAPSGKEEVWDTEDKLKVIGLRYCNVYGPGEDHKGKRASMIRQIGAKIGSNSPVVLFKSGEQKRDWIYIDDVVEANIKALNADIEGHHVLNCGLGKATTFNDLVREMKSDAVIKYIKNPHESFYQTFTECRMTKAKNLIDFKPKYDIHRGIKAYAENGLFVPHDF